jgi:hypothetical protein
LEAIRPVGRDYGLATTKLKPCIAFLLDGNFTASSRKCAFVLAIELRGQGFERDRVEDILGRWASKAGVPLSETRSALKSAFLRRPDGVYRYHPPGVTHKPSGIYAEVLKPLCDELGCPANCPAFSKKYGGLHDQTFKRFVSLGWEEWLRRRRWHRAIDIYFAVCRREAQLRFAPGAELLTTYKQLAGLANGIHYTSVGKVLRQLASLGLICFTAGSGDGPHARNRTPSRVQRVIPIPRPPRDPFGSLPALRTGRQSLPQIGSRALTGKQAYRQENRR